VLRREAGKLDQRMRAQQFARNLLRINTQGELQRVVDHILGEIELLVEDVVAGNPAALRAVARRNPLRSDHVLLKLFKVLRSKLSRGSPKHSKASATHTTAQKPHTKLRNENKLMGLTCVA